MLSNRAVPKYYGQFREKVLRGEIPVCEELSMEMNHIDSLIANPKYYYDPAPVEGWIKFCEHELTLTDGTDFHMLDSFKLWGEEIFGWYYFVDRSVWSPDANGGRGAYITKRVKIRLVNTQYIITARGSAKTMYDLCVQAYFLIVDTATTDQITTAPTMKQAEEVLSPFRTAIVRAKGPVFKMMTMGSLQNTTGDKADRVKLASTKNGIQNFMTNSLLEVRPMSVDKLQGSRCKIATVDEWLSGDTRESPIDALSQSATKNNIEDYVIVATSSEGTVRNGVGDDIKMQLMALLKGEYVNDHVSIFYYRLDDQKEIANPALWVKANPNIGKTVSYETYQIDVERAEKVPSAKNDILAKRFGIPCEGFTYFFTYEEIQPHRRHTYDGLPCALGCDLSQGGDFCAFAFLFPISNGDFGVKTINYISEYTFQKLPLAMHQKYEEFLKEGTLVVLPGTILDLMQVFDDLNQFIDQKQYDVVCVGYDPYNAKSFIDRWATENGPFGIEKVIQGRKTETVPLTELKKLAEDRRLIFDEKMMSYTMGNAIVVVDVNGNKQLMKRKYSEKIDSVAALMDAFVSYKINREAFE